MKRGQYSLEFLVTYAWAFLAIGIALAAIYSFGWVNFDSVLPERCEFYGQVTCSDFVATSGATEAINVKLINGFGAHVNVTDATIYNPEQRNICTLADPPGEFQWRNGEEQEFQFIGCNLADGQNTLAWEPGTRQEFFMNVTFYNELTATGADRVLHTQVGRLSVFINEE